jgi:hypothetical protein
MRSLIALLLASAALAATPHPDGSMSFQIYGRFGQYIATHTVVPPAEAANLSPTQFVSKLELTRRNQPNGTVYWLGPIYRHDPETHNYPVFYDGKIGKTSSLLVKDLRPGDVILIYVEDRR